MNVSYKSKLNEKLHALKYQLPVYNTTGSGTSFTSSFVVNGKTYATSTSYTSKAAAEESIACVCFNELSRSEIKFQWVLPFMFETYSCTSQEACKSLYIRWKQSGDAPELYNEFAKELLDVTMSNGDCKLFLRRWIMKIGAQLGYVKDLTMEGIEANPGPGKLAILGNDDVLSTVDFGLARWWAEYLNALDPNLTPWALHDILKTKVQNFSQPFFHAVQHFYVTLPNERAPAYSQSKEADFADYDAIEHNIVDLTSEFLDSGWVKDLTTEGIEPNPGPASQRANAKANSSPRNHKIAEEKTVKKEAKQVNEVKQNVLDIKRKLNGQIYKKSIVNKKIVSPAMYKTVKTVKGLTAMRKGIMLKTGRELTAETALVSRSFALPRSNGRKTVMIRMANLGQNAPTTVADPTAIYDAKFGATDHTLPKENFLAFLFRDPFRAIVQYDANESDQTYTYKATLMSVNNQQVGDVIRLTGNGSQEVEDIHIMKMTCTTAFQPHGPVLYPGRSKTSSSGKDFIWLNFDTDAGVGDQVTFSCVSANSDDGIILKAVLWDVNQANPVHFGTLENPGDTAVFAAPQSGYYAFEWSFGRVDGESDLSKDISMSFTGNHSVFCHHPLPQIEDNIDTIDALRIGGASVRYAERASPLNAQGSIIGAQMQGNVLWTKFIIDGYNSVAKQWNKDAIPIKNGFYAFVKPTDMNQLSFGRNTLLSDEIGTGGTYFILDDDSPYVVVAAKVESSDGRDAFLEYAFGVEYISQSTWRTYDKAKFPPSVFEDAMWHLADINQFHENPTHFSDIWKNIKMVVSDTFNGVANALPRVKQMLSEAEG